MRLIRKAFEENGCLVHIQGFDSVCLALGSILVHSGESNVAESDMGSASRYICRRVQCEADRIQQQDVSTGVLLVVEGGFNSRAVAELLVNFDANFRGQS
jgi:hypothetical protein